MTTKPTEEPEYISSATLMVLGTDLRPRDVSMVLGMRPSQAWSKGERKTFRGSVIGESFHEWGGWKKFLPASQEHRLLPLQLKYWARRLNNKAAAFSQLASLGFHCSLRCYVSTSGTASIVIPAELQIQLGGLGLQLELSMFASNDRQA